MVDTSRTVSSARSPRERRPSIRRRLSGSLIEGLMGAPDGSSEEAKRLYSEIRKKYLYCKPLMSIAEEYSKTPFEVLRICRDLSEIRHRNRQIRQMASDGVPLKKLAKEADMSLSAIYLICGDEDSASPMRRMTNDIRRRYVGCEPIESIAARYNLPIVEVSRFCKGLYDKRASNMRIRERYAAGEKQRDIAESVGIHHTIVCRVCRGVKAKEIRNQEILERRASGEKIKDIAEKVHLTTARVSQILQENGMTGSHL